MRSKRQRQDAVYHFITQACGDRPGYEEALRALYQDDDGKFAELVAAWPPAVRDYISRLRSA